MLARSLEGNGGTGGVEPPHHVDGSDIGSVVWREQGTVDAPIARLVKVWGTSPVLARRIVWMLQREYLSVRPAQLGDAYPGLRAALGPLVRD